MADEFIRQLPDGYRTVLDSEGTNLSMGQRQLIALARALASPAEILIFDEATANIATRTEIMIQKALDYVMQHKTTILIAHRLSTIRDVDNIVVLHKGQIVARGSHAGRRAAAPGPTSRGLPISATVTPKAGRITTSSEVTSCSVQIRFVGLRATRTPKPVGLP